MAGYIWHDRHELIAEKKRTKLLTYLLVMSGPDLWIGVDLGMTFTGVAYAARGNNLSLSRIGRVKKANLRAKFLPLSPMMASS